MKNLFTEIKNEVLKIEELEYVGENKGQLVMEEPPINFPCVLLGLGDADFSLLGQNLQKGNLVVEVSLADRYSTDGENDFVMYDIITKVNKVLQSAHGESFSRLNRTDINKRYYKNGVREFVIKYECEYTDVSSRVELIQHSATLKVIYED